MRYNYERKMMVIYTKVFFDNLLRLESVPKFSITPSESNITKMDRSFALFCLVFVFCLSYFGVCFWFWFWFLLLFVLVWFVCWLVFCFCVVVFWERALNMKRNSEPTSD